MDKLRRRCESRLRHMTLPDPFDLAELCQTVSERRGRPLHVRRIPEPPARARPCGIWIATDDDDWIFVDQDTSPLHRQHIVHGQLPHRLVRSLARAHHTHEHGAVRRLPDAVRSPPGSPGLLGDLRGLPRHHLRHHRPARLALRPDRRPLGGGLRLLAAGMVAGLTYLGYGTAVVVAHAAGVQGPFIRTAPGIIQALFGALIVLVAAGGVLPATQHWPVVRQVWLYRSLRMLYPLWAGLCQAVPGIALDPVRGWADRIDPRDLRMRLYRRVIEIRDGYMALNLFDVPGIEETVRAAAGQRPLSATDEAMVAAATRLELARRAEVRGEARTGGGSPRAYREFVAGADLDSEVRLLRVVAAHWPVICRAAETIERSSGPASR